MEQHAALRSRLRYLLTTASQLALAALVAACGVPGFSSPPASTGPQTPPRAVLVAVIVMENQSEAAVGSLPYLRSLAQRGAMLGNYRAVAHPSVPNYLALTSGSTWGIHDDAYHPLPAGRDLGHELSRANVPWRAYMESMTEGCFESPSPYAVKHNPFAYYGGECPPQVQPFELLDRDLDSDKPPRFIWITPNLCDDDHDCDPAVGDRWLQGVVPKLLAAPGYRQHGLIVIAWDEGAGGSDQAPALILSPDLLSRSSPRSFDHYSVLAAVEDRLGVPRLGSAAGADALTSLLRSAAVPARS